MNIEDLIKTIAQKTGLPETAVSQGVSAFLSFLKSNASNEAVKALLAKIPGASAAMESKPSAAPGGGGLLGGLMSAAGGLIGGQAGDMAKIAGALQAAGISADKAAPLVGEFLKQAETIAGPELLSKLSDSIPGLSDFLKTKSS